MYVTYINNMTWQVVICTTNKVLVCALEVLCESTKLCLLPSAGTVQALVCDHNTVTNVFCAVVPPVQKNPCL